MASASRARRPTKIATSRSNPRATPAQSGRPAARAASRRSSSGASTWPRVPAQAQVLCKPYALLFCIAEFMKAIRQFDAVEV